MGLPVLLVVDEDQAVLEALSGDLGRRFGLDYQILAESSPTQAVTVLQRLAADAQPVALIFAGQQLTEMPAVEFLVAAHGLHPAAKRILRLERGDYNAANPAVQAMTLGQIDYHLFTPWLPAERWLYPPVSDFLADWSRTQPPSRSGAAAGEDCPINVDAAATLTMKPSSSLVIAIRPLCGLER